ncbi:MAG: type II toxin-antitoxin system HicA family toxin [Pseudonocardiaceae bacterium]
MHEPVASCRHGPGGTQGAGWRWVRPPLDQGSHAKVAHPDGRVAVVPMHGGRDLPRGTLGSILRQTRLTIAEFRELL